MNICALGLECPDETDNYGECINSEACHRWTEAWDLYEIFILGDLPPIYLNNGKRDDWTRPEYGFERLNNCDFLLYYAAKFISFEKWKEAYYKLNRRYPAYVRKEHFGQVEELRKLLDQEYAQCGMTAEDIPF
ncbi:hypothetical protein NIES4072_31190 [Nostoc commune NIES-4072]|uniref:Uncharacterized protein n=1 Tax=Nostoc commune NIES-4072 TaxID=2005467 RepID=A0A2R5FUF0_NOSCO|nr:hypothetical protein [Nostoc commune]BBD69548.1 hypothetical protein NIES4070_59570 [Nostoc commune HK-02]GBG19451.1 hypothetical protein NIES4072_31190 [Nostoc commune NIES-4072]